MQRTMCSMHGEQWQPAADKNGEDTNMQQNMLSRRELLGLDRLQLQIEQPAEISRRTLLSGLGATMGLIAIDGISLVHHYASKESRVINEARADVCAGQNANCYLQQAQLPVPAVTETAVPSTTPLPPIPETITTTPPDTMPPTSQTTIPTPVETIPPIIVTEAPVVAAAEVGPYIRDIWWDGIEDPGEFMRRYLPMVPSLEQLAQLKGAQWADAAQQLAHIDWLNSEVSVTVEDYINRSPDRSRGNAFAHQPNYANRIVPYMYIYHWTARRYDQDAVSVDGLIRSLDRKGLRVANFADRNGNPFRLFDSYTRSGAHARSLNGIAVGGEYETESYGAEYGRFASPIYDFNPALVKTMILDGVEFCRDPEVNLPVDETTLTTHYVADLLFDTESYNPETGEIGTVDKWDPPDELVSRVILPKAKALDAALGPR